MAGFEQDLMQAREFVHKATKESVVNLNRVKEENMLLNKNKKDLYSAIKWPSRYPMDEKQKEILRKKILVDLEKQINKFTALNQSMDVILEYSGRTSVFRSLFFKAEEAIINLARGMKLHITSLGKNFANEGNALMNNNYDEFMKEFDKERVEYKAIFQLMKGSPAEGADITAIIRKNAKLAVSQEMKERREADPISDLARKGMILGAAAGLLYLLGANITGGSSADFAMDSSAAAKMVEGIIGGVTATLITVGIGGLAGAVGGGIAGIIKDFWITTINPRVVK